MKYLKGILEEQIDGDNTVDHHFITAYQGRSAKEELDRIAGAWMDDVDYDPITDMYEANGRMWELGLYCDVTEEEFIILRDVGGLWEATEVKAPEPDHVFMVRFTVPDEHLRHWQEGDDTDATEPMPTFASLIQHDVFDTMGWGGEFLVTEHKRKGGDA